MATPSARLDSTARHAAVAERPRADGSESRRSHSPSCENRSKVGISCRQIVHHDAPADPDSRRPRHRERIRPRSPPDSSRPTSGSRSSCTPPRGGSPIEGGPHLRHGHGRYDGGRGFAVEEPTDGALAVGAAATAFTSWESRSRRRCGLAACHASRPSRWRRSSSQPSRARSPCAGPSGASGLSITSRRSLRPSWCQPSPRNAADSWSRHAASVAEPASQSGRACVIRESRSRAAVRSGRQAWRMPNVNPARIRSAEPGPVSATRCTTWGGRRELPGSQPCERRFTASPRYNAKPQVKGVITEVSVVVPLVVRGADVGSR